MLKTVQEHTGEATESIYTALRSGWLEWSLVRSFYLCSSPTLLIKHHKVVIMLCLVGIYTRFKTTLGLFHFLPFTHAAISNPRQTRVQSLILWWDQSDVGRHQQTLPRARLCGNLQHPTGTSNVTESSSCSQMLLCTWILPPLLLTFVSKHLSHFHS